MNLDAQVLSHSVAAGITTLCMLGNSLPPETIHTAQFIEKKIILCSMHSIAQV